MSAAQDLQLNGDLGCQNAEVRGLLTVGGSPALVTVSVDGTTINGDGTPPSPLAVIPSGLDELVRVATGATIAGDGLTATPLDVVDETVRVATDATIDGDGLTASPLGVSTATLLPTRVTLWHDESRIIAGAALARAVGTTQLYNSLVFQNPAAVNDEWDSTFVIQAGAYTFSLLTATANIYGILSLRLNGVLFATTDLYTAIATANVLRTFALVVPTSGLQTLNGRVASKNAASAGFTVVVSKMWVAP
ncbi:MAG TPA: hypothetical protein VJA26_05585 [Gammaproteobacteria bacterium]|nr:hypothetical protein [Gammaproteobacteria bacterium]